MAQLRLVGALAGSAVRGTRNSATGDTVISSSTTSNQNNWAPGLNGNSTILWSGAADITVTGFAGGVVGQTVTFRNTGSNVATFPHNSGSSSSGNKLFNAATSAGTPVAGGGVATWRYDGTQWRLIAHDQGAWITPTFSAGNFTGGAATWTVDAGDVAVCKYKLQYKTLTVTWRILTTTVSGTPTANVEINNGAWGSFTSSEAVYTAARMADNGVNIGAAFNTLVGTGGTKIQYGRIDQVNLASATNTTAVLGTIRFEVD